MCACEFAPALGLTQADGQPSPEEADRVRLVEREQRGKWAYFSLDPAALERRAALVRLPEVSHEHRHRRQLREQVRARYAEAARAVYADG